MARALNARTDDFPIQPDPTGDIPMKRSLAAALAIATMLGTGAAAQAQTGHGSHGTHGTGAHGHHGHAAAPVSASPSTRAFEEANAKMHRDMAITFTGNADVDFVRGMIPHHQGAIDMARVVLRHGTNEWVKKLAQEVITAQEREIAEMREWLTRNAR
jgi:uncharacterized protein (DUF305 family)